MAGPRKIARPLPLAKYNRGAMLPFPPPLLPEPITVPGNVADGDYATRVRFVRSVGIGHLLSLSAFAALIALFMRPESRALVSRIGFESLVILSVLWLVLLAIVRHARVIWQIPVLVAFLLSLSAWLGTAVARWHETYPGFMETLGIGIATAWTSVLLYNLLCGRDYSFVGEFTLSFFGAVAFAGLYGIRVGIGISELVAVLTFCAIAVGYWTYDLAMILRRRTAAQQVEAVLDLYRDVLNVLGFPVRILHMPRRRGRSIS
jgi:hypothetical protein